MKMDICMQHSAAMRVTLKDDSTPVERNVGHSRTIRHINLGNVPPQPPKHDPWCAKEHKQGPKAVLIDCNPCTAHAQEVTWHHCCHLQAPRSAAVLADGSAACSTAWQ
jgi:hypothetical protein